MNSNACIIFDIDGVLINTEKSYNETIKETVKHIVRQIDPTIKNARRMVTDELIFNFRKSGMFNNDIDTSYALIISILCGPSKFSDLYFFIKNIIDRATGKGISSVEDYISSYSENNLMKIKRFVNYPGSIHESILTRIFDEYFYGPLLFKRQHHTHSKYYFGKPFIENDKVLVSYSTMQKLSKFFNRKVGIVSGRSRLAAEYSMKSLYKFFDINASFYLDDEKRKMSKPDPSALKKSIKHFAVNYAFYVGDSTEDLIMVKKIKRKSNINIEFIGICNTNIRPNQVKDFFISNGSYFIVKNVNELPNILNKVITQF